MYQSRRTITENFTRLSRVHERYRRQTTDRRQTDRQQYLANVNVSSRSLRTRVNRLEVERVLCEARYTTRNSANCRKVLIRVGPMSLSLSRGTPAACRCVEQHPSRGMKWPNGSVVISVLEITRVRFLNVLLSIGVESRSRRKSWPLSGNLSSTSWS